MPKAPTTPPAHPQFRLSEQEALALVQQETPLWAKALGLDDWELHCAFEPFREPNSDEIAVGETHLLIDYNRATINIDLSRIASTDHFLKTFHHELIHVLLARYHLVAKGISHLDKVNRRHLNDIFLYATEQTVEHLRVTLESLLTPETKALLFSQAKPKSKPKPAPKKKGSRRA